MAAFVEHRFKKGFLLDEEKLRKLVNIISQRLSKSDPPIPYNFCIFRADSYSYETDNVEDVINEDNADWRKITKLQIKATQPKEFEFELTFSDEGTSLNLNGNDRDQVYLLLSDLKEYLNNEVNTCFNVTRDIRKFIILIFPMLLFILIVLLMLWKISRASPSEADIKTAIDNQQVEQKLNFLILNTQRPARETRYIVPTLLAMPLVLVISAIMDKIMIFFCPSNIFLFGPQKQKYDRRRRLISKILWGIPIAFIISFLAGLMVWKMTK